MFRSYMIPDRLLHSVAALARVVRSSPATLAKAVYVFAFAVVVSLLLVPGRSSGQAFRGLPAVPAFPLGVPFNPILPMFGTGFTGFQSIHFSPPVFPGVGLFPLMAGPMFQFPLSNFGTDSTGFLGVPVFPFSVSVGAMGSPFGFSGFSSVGFGNGMGFGGFNTSGNTGFGGFSGFGGGFGGFPGAMGGFAGKGLGGFSGRNGL